MKIADRSTAETFEVAIIGGGPAGSCAASWLARHGHHVVQLEKESFPRFHIGESLLPNANGILKEIGVWEKIAAAGFIKKTGAEFTLPDRSRSALNVFSNGLMKGRDATFQVERSRFDQILFDHARECGSDSRQNQKVVDAQYGDHGWTLTIKASNSEAPSCTLKARWLIDASGRNSLIGRALKLPKEELPYPGRIAIFSHFRGMQRAVGERGGDIIVLRLEDAWFWAIPISDELTSVGVVAHKGAGPRPKESHADFFHRKVAQSSWLSTALEASTATMPFRVESDYSFSYSIFGDKNALLAGDAATFIDPVFSSGVYLALESGRQAAQTISKQLKRSANGRSALYLSYTKSIKRKVGMMRKLIDIYYDTKAFDVFMTPRPPLKIDRAVNSVLAGCLRPRFAVRWRIWLFEKLCNLHRRRSIVPSLDWQKLK